MQKTTKAIAQIKQVLSRENAEVKVSIPVAPPIPGGGPVAPAPAVVAPEGNVMRRDKINLLIKRIELKMEALEAARPRPGGP
jgi:hypothetical protein